jgi:hypothetical protein
MHVGTDGFNSARWRASRQVVNRPVKLSSVPLAQERFLRAARFAPTDAHHHAVLSPGQVTPRPLSVIPNAPRPSTTAGTFVPTDAPSLDANLQSNLRPVSVPRDRLDPKAFKTQNPRILASRSHASSLCVTTGRGHHRIFRWPGDRCTNRDIEAADQAALPKSGPRQGPPTSPSTRKSPDFWRRYRRRVARRNATEDP